MTTQSHHRTPRANTSSPAYRLYFLDGSGRIASAEWVEAASDDEAMAYVAGKGACPPCELWERNRLIHRFPLPHS